MWTGKVRRAPLANQRTPKEVRKHVLLAITNAQKQVEAVRGRRPLLFSDRLMIADYLMNAIPELGLFELEDSE